MKYPHPFNLVVEGLPALLKERTVLKNMQGVKIKPGASMVIDRDIFKSEEAAKVAESLLGGGYTILPGHVFRMCSHHGMASKHISTIKEYADSVLLPALANAVSQLSSDIAHNYAVVLSEVLTSSDIKRTWNWRKSQLALKVML